MMDISAWCFCPICAAKLPTLASAVSCLACGARFHSSPAATVSALCERRGRLLLARRRRSPAQGAWGLPGGFIEPGETIEETLRRELREELAVAAVPTAFFGSWAGVYESRPACPTVNVVWRVLLQGEPVAGDDVAEVGWFARSALPARRTLGGEVVAAVLRAWATEG